MGDTPNIRFKGFTDAWEQRKFGELADYKKGPFGSALKKDIFVPRDETTVKVYEQQNAINKDWTLERYFITKEYARKLSGFKVLGGDIIVSCAGTIGEIYEIPMDAEPGVINRALMKIKVNELVIDKKMFMILFSNMIDDFTRVHSNGSAIKNIPPFSDFKPMEVLVPKMEEQRKISKYITEIDHLITLHQRKCDEITKLKKYMLQKMFPQNDKKIPEIRFTGFIDAWEQSKLGSLCNFINGDRGSNYPSATDFQTKGIPFVGSDSLGMTYVNKNKLRFITSEKYLQMNGLKIEKGDILYTLRGAGFGKCSISDFSEGTVASSLVGIRCSEELLIPQFFIQWLNSANAENEKKKAVNGSTAQNISVEDMKLYIMYIPTIEEQEKIGEYLLNLDSLIAFHQNKCNMLKEVKRFMLQNMFPQKG